jgi:L-asparagine transporter-like permease
MCLNNKKTGVFTYMMEARLFLFSFIQPFIEIERKKERNSKSNNFTNVNKVYMNKFFYPTDEYIFLIFLLIYLHILFMSLCNIFEYKLWNGS